MSRINGISSNDWIKQNCPETGWFRVYWKDVVNPHSGGTTFDESEGECLRYEWEYKDGKRADGVARSWYPSGQLKEERTYKNGKQDGLSTVWYENGEKGLEGTFKHGELDGLWTEWYFNGQKMRERTYKDRKLDGFWTEWYDNGQKMRERTYKDGTRITKKVWSKDGK
tara:strand:- start:55 stop:558 length:504 start_codon:yes stop_codon:yes gene_type:complete